MIEPQTLLEIIVVVFGCVCINNAQFYAFASSNFMAHVLDRLFDKFRPDGKGVDKVTALINSLIIIFEVFILTYVFFLLDF